MSKQRTQILCNGSHPSWRIFKEHKIISPMPISNSGMRQYENTLAYKTDILDETNARIDATMYCMGTVVTNRSQTLQTNQPE